MTQNTEKKLWVLVSSLKEDAGDKDLEVITPKVSSIVDKWHSEGKFVLSGPLDNQKTGLAVFEATSDEAKKMKQENDSATSAVLDSYLYEWEALPFLSLLH